MCTSPIHLVITDIFMPDWDGLDVIRRLRHLHPNLKILAISGGSGTMDYLKEARAVGASRALYKPLRDRYLVKKSNSSCGAAGLRFPKYS